MQCPPREQIARTAALYGGALLITLVALTCVMELWRADLHVPLSYAGGDSMAVVAAIKGAIDNGWYLHNDFLGAPFGQDSHDYPAAHNLWHLVIKLISIFCSDPALVCNVFYLLTYPLTTLVALFVCRRLGFGAGPSLVGSLLYAFLPFHFARSIAHLYVGAYGHVPLMVLVIVWVHLDKFSPRDGTRWSTRDLRTFEVVVTIVTCILVSSASVYYAFFGCFLLLVAGVSARLWHGRWRPLVIASILVGVISVGVLVNIGPNLVYRLRHGANTEAVQRSPEGAEIYGLKVIQLLVPVQGHRVPRLASLSARYNKPGTPLVTENRMAALGLFGSCGFLFLVGRLLARRKPEGAGDLLDSLGILNIASVLLGTIGGLGAVFSYYISPDIRGYNRISVFIAFFALLALVWLMQEACRRYGTGTRSRRIVHAGLALVLIAGLLDMTPPSCIPSYVATARAYAGDADFVRRIEGRVPKGSMIYQLPYHAFPESSPVNGMLDYDLLRGYMHSRALRWSYGAMRGREGDLWHETVAAQPMDAWVKTVTLAGFAGVTLDRAAFADKARDLEAGLSKMLRLEPMVSDNGRLAFFDLERFGAEYRAQFTEEEWNRRREAALHMPLILWRSGFHSQERAPADASAPRTEPAVESWRWCGAQGKLIVINSSVRPKGVELAMLCATGRPAPARLRVTGDMITEELEIDGRLKPLVLKMTVPPGRHTLRFFCDAARLESPADLRELVFRVADFTLTERE